MPALVLAAALLCAVSNAAASEYYIREIISVHPGEEQARRLSVSEHLNFATLSPIEAYIVYSWGYTVPAGDLSIELACNASIAFRQRIGYSLIIGGCSKGKRPVLKWRVATFPENITELVHVDSDFGVYYIGVFVHSVFGDVLMPVPFSIRFTVTEGVAQ